MAALAATSLVVTTSCGSKEKKDTTPATTENVLALAFPSELAISAFPATSTSLTKAVDDVTKRSAADKIEDQAARIKGEGDCIDPDIFKTAPPESAAETCYEFDADMNPSTVNGRTTGTKTGVNSAGEACLVAFAREEVNRTVDMVDRALALIGGIMCQAKKDGLAAVLPEIGTPLVMTTSLAAALPIGLTSKSATMTRLADNAAGAAVYKSVVEVADSRGKTMTVSLVHSPGVDGAESGVLSSQVAETAAAVGDPNNTANKNKLMSINYSRETVSGVKRMRFEVRRASILNTITSFDTGGLVNYAGISDSATNETAHAMAFLSFDMDPDTNAGDMSYWRNPGGSLNEAARGFLFHIDAATDGTLSGCGVSGATASKSIRKSVVDGLVVESLKPAQWWHPQWSINSNADKDTTSYTAQTGPNITKQCFKRNSVGLYAIDTTKTVGARGYEMILGTASTIAPPPRPANKPAKVE